MFAHIKMDNSVTTMKWAALVMYAGHAVLMNVKPELSCHSIESGLAFALYLLFR